MLHLRRQPPADDAEEEEEYPEYNADTDSIAAMFAQQTHVFDRAA